MKRDGLWERKRHRLPASAYSHQHCTYHFTVCARHQGEPFSNPQLAELVVQSLLWTRGRYDWALYCYCLMPDHLHLVCALRGTTQSFDAGARGVVPEGILDHLARFKSFTTAEFWKLGHRGKLWQKSSFDNVLSSDEGIDDVVSYVLNNPVRKGLVERWEEWPYSRIVDPWV